MNAIKALFLNARPWQLFVLLLVAPMLIQFTAIIFPSMYVFVVVSFAYLLCVLAWLWSMGSFLSSVAPSEIKSKFRFFCFTLLFPLFYTPALLWFALTRANVPGAVIAILHLFAMYCMFYALNFVAKTLVTVQTGRLASFQDYAGQFLLLWFFPIGVWVIQPKISRLYQHLSNT
jgi:hypothetical protein